jgi:hypothetical protein
VKLLKKRDFFGCKQLKTRRRKNQNSIFSQLRSLSAQQAAEPQVVADWIQGNLEKPEFTSPSDTCGEGSGYLPERR